MKETLYNQKGEKVGQVDLPGDVFGLEVKADLIYQAAVTQMANLRKVISHTKDRGERRGGGRKPWRQKGTGRSRHGSIRSPIWRSGGVTFGPTKERVFSKKINKRTKRKALLMSLTSKVNDKEIVLIDNLEISQARTKAMVRILRTLSEKIKKDLDKGVLIVLPVSDEKILRAARNIPRIKTVRADNLNVLDLLTYKHLLISSPEEVVKIIQKTYQV